MYRSILVPLDGSTFGEQALPIAQSVARRTGAALRLIHVYVPFSERYLEDKAILDATIRVKEQKNAYLHELADRLTSSSDISITSALLDGKVGQIIEALMNYATATRVDLIVMTTHGYGALTRFWLGSIADKLVRRAPMPILFVRPKEDAILDFAHEQIFQYLLIPLDGSTLAEQILEPAIKLGQSMQADYRLLRVIEPITPVGYPSIRLDQDLPIRQRVEAEAQTYLDNVAERLRARSLQVQTQVVIHEQPAVAILEDASQSGIDLIALGTHGWSGLKRLLLGSVADKILRSASIPVLIHRPHDESSSGHRDS